MAIDITADPILLTFGFRSTYSKYPTAPRDPTLDILFDCQLDSDNPDIPELFITLEGTWLNICIVSDPIDILITPVGGYTEGILVVSDPINLGISFAEFDIITEVTRKNWIKWSGIGNIDFTIGRDNVAGERPLDWSGWIYEIRKLGNKVIVYGESGVSMLTPSDKFYGLETIHKIGLYSKRAVAGSDEKHYFIDKKGQMWKLEKTLEFLDYSEFFSTMGELIMSYDVQNDLIYICDGVYGFVYSLKTKSLGKGPINITGIGTKDGQLYIASAGTIEIPAFEICTDIYDFGTRKFKTLRSIEVGTDLTTSLQASIDYRVSNRVNFSNIGWHPVTLEGVSHMTCYGLEFRFKLRVLNYEYFEIDYLKINGLIHNYSYTEHTLRSITERRRTMYDS